MDENQEENVHFRMRLDEAVEDAVIPTQVDELRIEKLNHRITFIGILIPVLIVIILAVAYLDIKRRVIRTEDTGAVTAQNLTEDLESRFSTLSLKQAHIEEALAKLLDQTNQSIAKAQVNLQKMDERLKQSRSTMVSQKEMKSASQKIDRNLANVAKSLEEVNLQVDALTQSFQSRIGQAEQTVAQQGNRLAELKEVLSNLERNKIDKAALDLALKLEVLKIKQIYNAQLDEIQGRLKAMEQRAARQSAKPQAPSTSGAPPPPVPAPAEPDQLQEQTITR